MDIRRRIYPYPVLTYYKPGEDYKNGEYSVKISIIPDGYQIKISFEAELTEPGLASLISSGQAKFAYHIECVNTCYRDIIETDENKKVIRLSNKNVRGRLQVCPFIIATTDIKDYQNPNFHPDYDGMCFDIETGSILAVARQGIADLNNVDEDYRDVKSIFEVNQNTDETATEMVIDLRQLILILLPRKDMDNFRRLKVVPEMDPVLNSLTAIPALIYAIDKIKQATDFEREGMSNDIWYKVIKKMLLKRFKCDIDTGGLDAEESFIWAQRLINNPLSDGLNNLAFLGSQQKGAEDE